MCIRDSSWVLRELIGPHDPKFMSYISGYVGLVRRGVYTVLMVALLAAAIDRILRPATQGEATEEDAEALAAR